MIPIHYSAEVARARDAGAPIVALESTIITHGMPFPQNVETARLVEEDVRGAGATPATIAVLYGVLHIGLEADQLEALGQAQNVAKLSRADMAACIATGGTGAATVAATMIAAHLAGIHVFATGGSGGVHRGAEDSFDISADLRELAQTPVTVVSAGAKAILDLPAGGVATFARPPSARATTPSVTVPMATRHPVPPPSTPIIRVCDESDI